jgi:hypothetical protein
MNLKLMRHARVWLLAAACAAAPSLLPAQEADPAKTAAAQAAQQAADAAFGK